MVILLRCSGRKKNPQASPKKSKRCFFKSIGSSSRWCLRKSWLDSLQGRYNWPHCIIPTTPLIKLTQIDILYSGESEVTLERASLLPRLVGEVVPPVVVGLGLERGARITVPLPPYPAALVYLDYRAGAGDSRLCRCRGVVDDAGALWVWFQEEYRSKKGSSSVLGNFDAEMGSSIPISTAPEKKITCNYFLP